MVKLAFRNILSKPYRSVGTILVIAITIAMIFCMLSFKATVYDYMYASETSAAGSSDILISTQSSSDRITDVATPLESMSEIKEIVPCLSLYALLNNEYIQIRGYQENQQDSLQTIDYIEKSSKPFNLDSVIISKSCAAHFGIGVDDMVMLTLGSKTANFYIYGIAQNSGYFLSDSPYQFIGRTEWVAKLVAGITSNTICNEIYIKINDGVDGQKVIDTISSMEKYKNLNVDFSKDDSYIASQTSSLTAPVVLSGASVMCLGIAFIIMLFLMSAQEKMNLISKLSVIGATKKQIFVTFIIESFILSIIGTIIGSALSIGIFVALIKFSLSATIAISISVLKLFGAAIIGFVVSIISSLIPMFKAFNGSIRENQLLIDKKSNVSIILTIVFAVLTIVSVIIEFTVHPAMGVMGIISLVFALITIAFITRQALSITSKCLSKSSNPVVRYASIGMLREKRFSRSIIMLTVGMTVAMMLFMAWNVTTNIFTSYIDDFKDMAFVTNVQSSVNVDDFYAVDGVEDATKMVWGKGEIGGNNFKKTINILGSKEAIDILNFEFITPKDVVKGLVSADTPYVLLDKSMNELYGVDVGDTIKLTIDDKTQDVIVGGILRHELFSGNYLIMSAENIKTYFGKDIDTVLVITDGNTTDCVNNLRATFANKNYYCVEVLEVYKWDKESMESVFDLIGTLAVVVALFIFMVTVTSAVIGRGAAKKELTAYLNAGMSKNTLLGVEIVEHTVIAIISFVLSYAISVLLTSSLIHALRLFGLYFTFMYSAWVVAVVGVCLMVGYILVPVALNFKRSYTIKR